MEEDEDWGCYSDGTETEDQESINLKDWNDEEYNHSNPYKPSPGFIPKLQFRKDVSKARWDEDMGMAEVTENKGGMWRTTGIIRGGKLYCLLEEILFSAERGALILLDANDAALSLTDIYEKVAKDKNGCSWESFEVYRHLKSLGYIINRYGLPWTLKINKSCCNSKCSEGTLDSDDASKPNREDESSSILCQLKEMRINEMMPNFDVYLPNSKFRKSAPGNPSFILYLLSDDPPSKAEIQVLEAECKGIPLKFCHLEHGRVSFFSFDKVELPFLP
ncbi:tRNA-splicing endonuclease [Cinnamomum micranthum f. kanehirae]|uniref:tRNA-splicing endonuclease n=1 Tax=Cinnamomum micranthum f. kanehirae TaxID=337451 RepID=A0A3S3P754_9MAGN|nr:tRNA-splicing endonuclease [Cinnamomum micranthum f. kanehirae]